ncbi:MAG: head GIN domain-containing protein [Sphingopyxis sp.]|jgi:hypothetical protein|uniref:head GIN domain-containing protein n=1 Tax=Sphingopyxis sp. TaxID=1908224 RepID=UPI003D6CDC66
MASLIRWTALAAATLLTATSASAAEKRYGLTSFETIEVTADVAVEVVTRSPVSAVATGSPDALDRLTVEARDGRLIIGQKIYAGDENRRQPLGQVLLRVNAANLRSASIVGAGSLQIDRLKGTKVEIGLRGPGRLTVGAVTTDRLSVAMIGNGTMTLGGTAKIAQMTLSGAGAVDAGKLAVGELVTSSEGTGDHVFQAVKSAAITTRGLGRTVVLGKPVCTVRNAGSGTVQCGAAK